MASYSSPDDKAVIMGWDSTNAGNGFLRRPGQTWDRTSRSPGTIARLLPFRLERSHATATQPNLSSRGRVGLTSRIRCGRATAARNEVGALALRERDHRWPAGVGARGCDTGGKRMEAGPLPSDQPPVLVAFPDRQGSGGGSLRPTGPRLRSTSAGPAIRPLPVVVEVSRPRSGAIAIGGPRVAEPHARTQPVAGRAGSTFVHPLEPRAARR